MELLATVLPALLKGAAVTLQVPSRTEHTGA